MGLRLVDGRLALSTGLLVIILAPEAYLPIQRQSRQRRKSKKEVAEAIVLGDELRRGKG